MYASGLYLRLIQVEVMNRLIRHNGIVFFLSYFKKTRARQSRNGAPGQALAFASSKFRIVLYISSEIPPNPFSSRCLSTPSR